MRAARAPGAVAIIALAAALCSPAVSAQTPPPRGAVVGTFAGSGALGFADGTGTDASFAAPAGMAFATSGVLYVADRDAQRIRAIDPAGRVSTLAGSGELVPLGVGVPGGYRDGPAATARFDTPEDVAVLPDGSVLVADAGNHCIRRIAGGVVSTYAGNAAQAGDTDGPRARATFGAPRSLAVDGSGTVYVADPPELRRIDRDGSVTTLRFARSFEAVAVATVPGRDDELLIAAPRDVFTANLPAGTIVSDFETDNRLVRAAGRIGWPPAGPVAALAAFRDDDFVYADPLSSALRYAQSSPKTFANHTTLLSATPPEDAANRGSGGYADGPAASARFDQPDGVAIAADGRVFVADTGNRRIRVVSAFDHRSSVTDIDDGAGVPHARDPKVWQIAFVGSSNVWANAGFSDSMAGIAEDALRAGRDPSAKPVVFSPVMSPGAGAFALLSLIDEELAEGTVDAVILELPGYGYFVTAKDAAPAFPPGWEGALARRLATVRDDLRRHGAELVVLSRPGANDLPNALGYGRLWKGTSAETNHTDDRFDPGVIERYHDAMEAAVRAAGVPEINLWPAFLAAYRSPARVPLFGTWDHHLTAAGRTLVGTALASYVRRELLR